MSITLCREYLVGDYTRSKGYSYSEHGKLSCSDMVAPVLKAAIGLLLLLLTATMMDGWMAGWMDTFQNSSNDN